MRKSNIYSIISLILLLFCGLSATSQEVVSPCPEVLIDQKYDHVTCHRYRIQGWDTAVTCNQTQLELTAEPFIPVQYFNGTYLVEEVPFNPPDPSFAQGTRMPMGTDDDFSASTTAIDFPFFFFGIKKTGFRLGANGMITFATNQFGGGNGCPWSFSAALPWPNGKAGVPTMPEGPTGSVPLARMRDAIYGIYEDTQPVASYLTGQQGVYYGIQGEWPCRKIICSWNGIPTYKGSQNLDNRCTYQIVCYEGSNIIEVHVKRRGVNLNWQSGRGIIGIQNATGQPQVRDSINEDAPNRYVANGSPAAFWPEGKNTFNTTLDSVAYRFTPQGTTSVIIRWYRINENGEPVMLSTNIGDPNGYYFDKGYDPDHPTRTKAVVTPTVDTRYLCTFYFQNANGDEYLLSDSIMVGVDTVNTLILRAHSNGSHSSSDVRQYDICRGAPADIRAEYTDVQEAENLIWTIQRISNGDTTLMDESLYQMIEDNHTARFTPVSYIDNEHPDRIDSIYITTHVDFVSGCRNHDTFLLRILPNYDITDSHNICVGDTLLWTVDNHIYTESNNTAYRNLGTAGGCDSIIHLALTVYGSTDEIDKRDSCAPITWHGRTFSESNTATEATDTIHQTNSYGCTYTVRLRFTLHPVEAHIKSSKDQFSIDDLEVDLTDISIGSDSRIWILTDGEQMTTPTIHYTLPYSHSMADITLIAQSPYGCADTTNLVIPLNRETFWVPNAFTPNHAETNNRFFAVSTGTLHQEMYIYNRLGEMMFHCEGEDCAWDGTDTHGRPCVQGAYVYIIRYNDIFDPSTTKIKKGTVTLLR